MRKNALVLLTAASTAPACARRTPSPVAERRILRGRCAERAGRACATGCRGSPDNRVAGGIHAVRELTPIPTAQAHRNLPMPKNPDERIDSLEKSVRNYKILAISLLVLMLVTQRARIVGWIDRMENWTESVTNARAS